MGGEERPSSLMILILNISKNNLNISQNSFDMGAWLTYFDDIFLIARIKNVKEKRMKTKKDFNELGLSAEAYSAIKKKWGIRPPTKISGKGRFRWS